MAWFTPEFEAFFADLKKNNNREWFQENKKRYEKHVKKPFSEFVGEMILRMQVYDPQCKIEPKDAIFRINRDIRFSKDKTPYKTNVSAVIGRGGRKGMDEVGMYLELSHQHARVYGGVYMPDKDQLFKIRQEIRYNLEDFKKLVTDKTFVKMFGEIRGEKNKRLTPEFAEIEDEMPLIANKQFYYFTELNPSLITSDALVDEMYKAYDASKAIREFLMTPLRD